MNKRNSCLNQQQIKRYQDISTVEKIHTTLDLEHESSAVKTIFSDSNIVENAIYLQHW